MKKTKSTQETDVYLSKKLMIYFGDLYLNQVKPKVIEEYIEFRRKEGVTDTTIHHELVSLKHAFKLGVTKWDLADNTPFDKVNLPRGDRQRTRFLTREEAAMILDHASDVIRPFIIVALDTGLRISNICNLTWKQADVFSRTIRIEKPKNGKPISIPMTDRVHETLNEIKKNSSISLAYFFPSADGLPSRRNFVSKSFKRICNELGIRDISFH